MLNGIRILAFSTVVGLASLAFDQPPASGQTINVSTPLTSVSDSFYENFGVNFGFGLRGGVGGGSRVVGLSPQGQRLPYLFFQNGAGGVNPPFGGYSPNSGARFGFGNSGPNGGYSLGFNLAQGSTRTSTTVAPSLTVQNGFGGSLTHGQFRPFVTGVVPVVGGGAAGAFGATPAYGFRPGFRATAPIDNGVTRALNSGQLDLRTAAKKADGPKPRAPVQFSHKDSSAQRGDLSVAEIKAQRARKMAARKQQFDATLAEAKQMALEKRLPEARVKFKAAARLTDDKRVKAELNQWIRASRSK